MTEAANHRRRLDPDRRRAEIIAAATGVFLRLGYAATTFRDIAEAAQVSLPLTYKYFSSKDEIFETAVRQPLEKLLRSLDEASNTLLDGDEDTLPDRLERFHQRMLTGIAELTPYIGVALFAADTDSTTYYTERMRPLLWSSADALRTALEKIPGTSPAPAIVVTALYGMYFGVDLNAMLRGKKLDVASTSRQLARLLTHGLDG